MGIYDSCVLPHLINLVMNTKQTREIRRRVCVGLAGDVLEIGFGTGHNFPTCRPRSRLSSPLNHRASV